MSRGRATVRSLYDVESSVAAAIVVARLGERCFMLKPHTRQLFRSLDVFLSLYDVALAIIKTFTP